MAITNAQESPVKHTIDGEMPDTSRIGQLKRRLQADAPVLFRGAKLSYLSIPLAVIGVGAVGYYLYRNGYISDWIKNFRAEEEEIASR